MTYVHWIILMVLIMICWVDIKAAIVYHKPGNPSDAVVITNIIVGFLFVIFVVVGVAAWVEGGAG